jgi:hypothetical protein
MAATQVNASTSVVTFSASGFTDQDGSAPAPVDPISGSFTLTGEGFDVSGITFDSLSAGGVSLADPGVATVTYSPYFLCPCVGGLGAEFADGLTGGNFQFSIHWPSFSPFIGDSGTFGSASYFVSGVGEFETTSIEWSQVVVTSVPEPATWAMFLLGFGGIGMAMRGGRRSASAALTLRYPADD